MSTNAAILQGYLAEHSPEYIHPDATMRDHALGQTIEGAEAIAGQLRYLYEVAFPGASAEMRRLIDGDDAVTLEFTFRGTQNGPFGDLPPTGKPVEVPMCATYGITGGKIASIDLYYDAGTFMRQLG